MKKLFIFAMAITICSVLQAENLLVLNQEQKCEVRTSVSCTAPNHPGMRAEKAFNSRGGTFGTWLNLFGDGMERLGEQVAVWLAGEF